jgi:hypothetical protein
MTCYPSDSSDARYKLDLDIANRLIVARNAARIVGCRTFESASELTPEAMRTSKPTNRRLLLNPFSFSR